MTMIAELSVPATELAAGERRLPLLWTRVRAFFAAVAEIAEETGRLKREAALRYPFLGY